MVNAGQPIADELFGNVCQSVAIALFRLFCREGLPFTNVVEYFTSAIGDSSVELAVFVVIVSSAHPVGSVLVYPSQLQRFAVVVGRVAAAMMDHYRMLL